MPLKHTLLLFFLFFVTVVSFTKIIFSQLNTAKQEAILLL